MNAQDIRNKYLDYMKNNGHSVIPRALISPKEEAGVLFTGSGMQPLIPYLLGETHPGGVRLVNSQTCLRAGDIEEVGDNRHTTFFEMLGNWSLGDYFKAEQLPWFYDFLVETVGLDPSKLYATCFIGDEEFGIPKDEASAELVAGLFKKYGVSNGIAEVGSEEDGYMRGMNDGERVFYYDSSKNWWAPEGKPGNMSVGQPGGPDSELFYLFDSVEHDTSWGEHCHPNCDCGRFMEIGNSVFMEYIRTESGFEKLPKQNVDFGGGLERIAAAALDSPDVFKISVLWPIVEALEKLSGKSYVEHTESMRVIADHLRGAMFLAVDGVVPSNKEAGYVMRRLVRRAMVKAFDLGIEQHFIEDVVPMITALYEADFPEVEKAKEDVVAILSKEEKAFRQTLRKGRRELTKMLDHAESHGTRELSGQELFKLYDTFGFPVEVATEIVESLDDASMSDNWQQQYDEQMKSQRERSQTAAKGAFKGGLGGSSDIHKKYHTATHLMYQALRDVLGDHVIQRGSNITEERLRFDFSHPEKMTPEQIEQVETIVNQQIQKDLQVSWAEYPTQVAREEKGALGQFGDRYGDTVKVYQMQADGEESPFSFEICGGPHVDHTGQLSEDSKTFKIQKEQSSSAGIRRIKAVLK